AGSLVDFTGRHNAPDFEGCDVARDHGASGNNWAAGDARALQDDNIRAEPNVFLDNDGRICGVRLHRHRNLALGRTVIVIDKTAAGSDEGVSADDNLAAKIKCATGANENVLADEEARSGLVDAI